MKKQIVVLIAPQRSGTTVFQKTLSQSRGVQTFGEVFHSTKGSSLISFFNYIKSKEEITEKYLYRNAENSYALFKDYFRLIEKTAQCKFCIVDIKQNSLHHFDTIWHNPGEEPKLLKFIKSCGYKIIRIKRKNIFSQVLSTIVANKIGKYHVGKNENIPDLKQIRIDPVHVEKAIREIEKANALVDGWVEGYKNVHFIDYEDMFDGDAFSGKLNDIVRDVFRNEQVNSSLVLKKINKDLRGRVSNIREVRNFFSGTKYMEMIQDAFGVNEGVEMAFFNQTVKCIENYYNKWCLTDDPSKAVLHLHPNKVGNPGASVSFLGIDAGSCRSVSFAAIAGNVTDLNPGAVLKFSVSVGDRVVESIERRLKPREKETFEVSFDINHSKIDLHFVVENTPEAKTNACSGVAVSDLRFCGSDQ